MYVCSLSFSRSGEAYGGGKFSSQLAAALESAGVQTEKDEPATDMAESENAAAALVKADAAYQGASPGTDTAE